MTIEEVAQARLPWHGVKWTLIYVGLLGYIQSITTYRVPIGDVSMALALLGLLIQRERFRMPPLLIGLAIFLGWCVLGYAVTDEPQMVFQRLQVVGKLWLIALVAANALRTRAQIRFFLAFWLACFAFYPVRGSLFNYYLYGESVVGRAAWNYIFSNPNDLAAYCILQLSMALGLLYLEKRGPVKWGTIAGLAVIPFVIMMTKSRGAFLGFAAFLLMTLVGHRKRGKAIVITVVLAGLVVAVAPPDVLNRVRGLENVQSTDELREADKEGSAYQRYEIWKVARTIIRENPVMGVGLGAYPAAHNAYAVRPQFDPTAQGWRDTHSTYLNVTAETGFIGALIFLGSYLFALLKIDGVRRRAKKLLPVTAQTLFVYEAGALGFFVAGTFGSMAHVSFLALHVILTWTIAELAESEMAALKPKWGWNGAAAEGSAPIPHAAG
ncbi:MAG: O-antigen ligase family protein [Gemmatimonadaceae bacterium]